MRAWGVSLAVVGVLCFGPERAGAQTTDYGLRPTPPPRLTPEPAPPPIPAENCCPPLIGPVREPIFPLLPSRRNKMIVCPPCTVDCPPTARPQPAPAPPPVVSSAVPPTPIQPLIPQPPPIALTPWVCIEKVGPKTVALGQSLKYEIIVRNVHGIPVREVHLADELPSGCRLLTSEPKALVQSDKLHWDLGTMPPKDERHFHVTVQPAGPGEFKSCASVTFTADACLQTIVTHPKLELVKTGPETVHVGDKAVFQMRLTNAGTGPAVGVVLHDELPDGLQHPSGTNIDAEVGTLPPGESKQITLETKAVRSGRFVNKATAWADNHAVITAQAAVLVTEPALTLKKTGPGSRFVNRDAEFVLELSNTGTGEATNVRVLDKLPAGLEFVSADAGGAYDASSRTITWQLGTLGAGMQRQFTARLACKTGGDFVNQAVALADGGLQAPASAPLHVEGVAALLLEVVDLDDPVELNSETTYEIRVVNQGSSPCTGLRILAIVPEGMQPLSATGPATYRIQGQQVIFEPLSRLAPRADVLYRVKVACKKVGDWRFRAQMSSDQLDLPVNEDESTRVYRDHR